MKRITIIIMALLCGAFLFAADTGYGRNQWYSDVSEVVKKTTIKKRFQSETERINYSIETGMPDIFFEQYQNEFEEQKTMLGEQTKVFFQFSEYRKLICVNYMVEQNKITKLKSKLNAPVKEIKSIATLGEDTEQTTDWYRMAMVTEAMNIEVGNDDGLNGMKKDGEPGRVLIYDYNDDTRLYLFENIIKDKAVVVYVPHEQDY